MYEWYLNLPTNFLYVSFTFLEKLFDCWFKYDFIAEMNSLPFTDKMLLMKANTQLQNDLLKSYQIFTIS